MIQVYTYYCVQDVDVKAYFLDGNWEVILVRKLNRLLPFDLCLKTVLIANNTLVINTMFVFSYVQRENLCEPATLS